MSGAVTVYNPRVQSIQQQLAPYTSEFAKLLPASITPAHMIAAACASLMNNDYSAKIAQENPVSVAMSVMTASVLALELDGVTGQGHLVPFGGKTPKITFMPGYQGYITLASRSGYALQSFAIHSSDEFSEEPSALNPITHKVRHFQKSKRGDVIGYYALAKHASDPMRHVVMDMDEILKVRDRSSSYQNNRNNSVWTLDFPAMCLKTPLRTCGKRMPLRTMQLAAGLDVLNDIGRPTYLRSEREAVIDGNVVDADALPATNDTPLELEAPLSIVTPDGKLEGGRQTFLWSSRMLRYIATVPDDRFQDWLNQNREHIQDAADRGLTLNVQTINQAIKARQDKIAHSCT